MANRSKEAVLGHAQLEQKKKLESSEGLPFRDLLSEEKVRAALKTAEVTYRDRIFNPMVTLWAWLSQSISKKDASCEDTVARVIADRVAHRQKACSPDNSSYCAARRRLSEEVVVDLTHQTGQELHRQALLEWLWKARRVVLADGSTATMADTAANQAEYPQSRNQKAGLGFPILRLVVLLSLSVGTVLKCAVGRCRGKKTGEQSLFRQMWDALEHGEIILADRLYDSYRDIALLKERGVDVVFGKKQSRNCDFRRGRKLGKDDHVIAWKKPKYDASRYESKAEWEALPAEMEIREVRVTVRREGYRTRKVVVVTTLLDGEMYSAKELTDLFSERWHIELDLRSIKRSLGMHHLTSKSPEMVRKELWMYLLAYNLIRVRMAQAAALHGPMPRRLSFTAAKALMDSFAPHLSTTVGQEHRRIEAELLRAIARCRIPKRPGRKEPRAIKKRVQKYSYLTKPRTQARKQLAA
jgi:hypothetical protein